MQKIMFNDAYGLTEATIEGRKTMTRRLEFSEVQELCLNDAVRMDYSPFIKDNCVVFEDGNWELLFSKPTRYKIGEVLAVAQRYSDFMEVDKVLYRTVKEVDGYRRELASEQKGWNNKLFVCANLMPHRIRITDVRVERLQDISDEDCIKEGVLPDPFPFGKGYVINDWKRCRGYEFSTPREAFAALIDKVSGRGTWDCNPWVVAYEYEIVK